MGINERRKRDKERRRNEILDAAERVFFSKGVNIATMDDVAGEAELSKGTLYLYFKSKQELYLGINQRGFDILGKMFLKAIKNKKTGLEKIKAMGYAYFEFAKKYPDYYKAMMYFENSGIDFPGDEVIFKQFRTSGFRVLHFVEDIIQEGKDDDSIVSSLNAEKLAFLLWGQTSGVIQIIAKIDKHPDIGLKFKPVILFKEFIHITENELITHRQ